LFARAFGALVLLATLAGGCHGAADAAHRADVARVARAVDVLRNAPNDAKLPPLIALQHTACRSDDACGLERSCLDAYDAEQRALQGTDAVRHALAGDAGAAAAERAGTLLALSQRELGEAHRLTRRCADLEGELHRRYKF
jgi:hypothetical protein